MLWLVKVALLSQCISLFNILDRKMYKIGINDFNDAIFEKIVVVLFGAEYSNDTTQVRDILTSLEKDFPIEVVEFYEIDVDEYPQICDKFGIDSIPTTGIFKQAKAKVKIDGVKDKEVFKQILENYLK